MPLGKTLLELANKGYNIRFIYSPMEPEQPFYSDNVTMLILKGGVYQRIDFDIPIASQADDAYVDTLLESALENGAKNVMERLLEENNGSD